MAALTAGRTPLSRHHHKVVLITGAARGIGRATAEVFAAQGATIVACDIDGTVTQAQASTSSQQDLEQTEHAVRAVGAECLTQQVDVRDQDSVDAAVGAAIGEFGHLDVVVANAGIMLSKPFWEVDEHEWLAVLDINVGGVWRIAKAVAPQMIRQMSGVILATASVQSRTPRRGLSIYTASKHGVSGLMKSIALELGEYGIRANTVLPGAIHTPMIDNESTGKLNPGTTEQENRRTAYFRRMSVLRGRSVLDPSAIANAFSWLASEEAREITGIELPVDAGSLILPGYNGAPVRD
jgi:NAD(P)-dependent dehydrogenase (short-subunit alcohol dehydrogenase family)